MQENCQKIKLLKLMELLRQETDELHPLSTNEICNRLGSMGISCERRTLAKDTEAVEALRQLVYNFLSAENAIKAAAECNELSQWVHSVVDGLNPSIKDYSRKQIDLALALIIHEQVLRDPDYNDLLVRFAEIYKTEGGVF